MCKNRAAKHFFKEQSGPGTKTDPDLIFSIVLHLGVFKLQPHLCLCTHWFNLLPQLSTINLMLPIVDKKQTSRRIFFFLSLLNKSSYERVNSCSSIVLFLTEIS